MKDIFNGMTLDEIVELGFAEGKRQRFPTALEVVNGWIKLVVDIHDIAHGDKNTDEALDGIRRLCDRALGYDDGA